MLRNLKEAGVGTGDEISVDQSLVSIATIAQSAILSGVVNKTEFGRYVS